MSPPSPDISVVLCCHNPKADVLARVLQALQAQTLAADRWELVLVDNASSPPLSQRALALPEQSRIVVEPALGLTPARLCGFAQAVAPVLVLIDDDTIAATDYLEVASRQMALHPEIGVMGGRIRGEFARPAPGWAEGYLDLLVLRDFGDRPIRALVDNMAGPWEPCGAGMVVRREVAQAYALAAGDARRRGLDRVGGALTSCGDTDLARTAPDLGLMQAYEPGLHLTHVIPPVRVSLRYLVRLTYAIQRDAWYLSRLRGRQSQTAGLRRWLLLALAPVRTFTLHPCRWALRLASALGQIRGRSLPLA